MFLCAVFAYGATGAGKTHTMLGSESNPGVIYHTMIYLYKHISEMSEEKTCDVAVSYLEVSFKFKMSNLSMWAFKLSRIQAFRCQKIQEKS